MLPHIYTGRKEKLFAIDAYVAGCLRMFDTCIAWFLLKDRDFNLSNFDDFYSLEVKKRSKHGQKITLKSGKSRHITHTSETFLTAFNLTCKVRKRKSHFRLNLQQHSGTFVTDSWHFCFRDCPTNFKPFWRITQSKWGDEDSENCKMTNSIAGGGV